MQRGQNLLKQIQIRTWVKKFSVYIIQIKINVESIQIRKTAFKIVISSLNLACILRMCVCINLLKQNVWNA